MSNKKQLTPYYAITAILVILGLLFILWGTNTHNNIIVISGIVILLGSLTVILVAYHQQESFWAPPREGRFFMGLADPAQMVQANYTQIALSQKGEQCKTCANACHTCMRYPFKKQCIDAQKECMESKCESNLKNMVHRNCTISGSPNYSPQGN